MVKLIRVKSKDSILSFGKIKVIHYKFGKVSAGIYFTESDKKLGFVAHAKIMIKLLNPKKEDWWFLWGLGAQVARGLNARNQL